MRRRLLIALAVLGALLLAVFAGASADRCGAWPPANSALTGVSRSEGPLRVGAARVALAFDGPITVGGYAPWRHTATGAAAPLSARALVLESGGQRLGLVLLDVLLIAPGLRDHVGAGLAYPAWVLATHTHSGPGGFDTRPAAQLAGLGAFDPAVEAALVRAARQALEAAEAALAPARLSVNTQTLDGFATARSGPEVDRRLTVVRFDSPEGRVAELVIAAAHPTLVPRGGAQLDPDWPGALAALREAAGSPVTLVVQGAGGNASVDRARAPDPSAAARVVDAALQAPPAAEDGDLDESAPVPLAWGEVRVALPRPEASRLVPAIARAFTENLLCDGAEDQALLHGLRVGPLRLLFVPLEPSFAAGRVLEEQARVQRVVSLADGYAGYVETVEAARAETGESHRQYFPPELLERLAEGARLVGDTLGK